MRSTPRDVLIIGIMLTFFCNRSEARLIDISFETFRQQTYCGYLVEVQEARRATNLEALDGGLSDLNHVAKMRVLKSTSSSPECLGKESTLILFYSGEVHSSQPQQGETALLFANRRGEHFEESVYGRSYWRIKNVAEVEEVEITWRNEFLIAPIDLLSGEVAYVPLDAVLRLITDD